MYKPADFLRDEDEFDGDVPKGGELPNVVAVQVKKKHILISSLIFLILIILLLVFGRHVRGMPFGKKAASAGGDNSRAAEKEEPWWKKFKKDAGQEAIDKQYRQQQRVYEKISSDMQRQTRQQKYLEEKMRRLEDKGQPKDYGASRW